MPRGKQSAEKTLEKAIARAEEIFGIKIEAPAESPTDLMREAQSVLTYFEAGGRGFKEKPCKRCSKIFAYCWDHDSISYCSISCIKLALQEVGLDWDPSKTPFERWGKTVPAVVPPQALDQLKDNLALQEDLSI